jgi:zinc transporter 1/2/3
MFSHILNLVARHITAEPTATAHEGGHASLDTHEHEHAVHSQCGAHQTIDGGYDVRLHVIALFIMLLTSSLASCGPLYVRRVIEKQAKSSDSETELYDNDDRKAGSDSHLKNKIINWFQWLLWVARHFGTGVIIGTTFIHLLPGAHEVLTHPCLPEFWSETYSSMPEAIAMTGAFVMFLIDFFSKRWIDYLQKRALEKDGAMIAVAAGVSSF